MAGQFTRKMYDDCAFVQNVKQSTDPLELRMDVNKFVNCNNICRPHSQRYQPGSVSLVDIESSLWGIDKLSSDCDSYKHPFCRPHGCLLTRDPSVRGHMTPFACERGRDGDNAVITTNMRMPRGPGYRLPNPNVCNTGNGYYSINTANGDQVSLPRRRRFPQSREAKLARLAHLARLARQRSHVQPAVAQLYATRQNGLAQNGAVQNGLSSNGAVQNGLAPNGLAQNGLAQNGLTPNGLQQNGLSSNGLASNGVAQSPLVNELDTVVVVDDGNGNDVIVSAPSGNGEVVEAFYYRYDPRRSNGGRY